MNQNGDQLSPECTQPVESVAARLAAIRNNLPAARAQANVGQDLHHERRRELRQSIIRAREEHRRLLGERLPGDLVAAVIGGVVGIAVVGSLWDWMAGRRRR